MHLLIFFKINFLENHQSVKTVLDPDQTQHFVRPDLGQNCLQRLSLAGRSGSVGRALDWGSKGCWFTPHCRKSHCVLSLSKTLCPLLSTGSTQEDPSQDDLKIVDWDIKNQNKQRLSTYQQMVLKLVKP